MPRLRFWAARLPLRRADNRIRTLAYDPEQIVRILGKPGIQSTIEFAADERIENVAVGDSSAWQITPNRRASLLFVKPLARAQPDQHDGGHRPAHLHVRPRRGR